MDNPVDYWWTMRALLLAMHKWVKEGAAPPPSLYPRLQDRTLVPAASVAFPAIPGVDVAAHADGWRSHRQPVTCKGGAGAGAPLPLLVPAVDEDGNERAGIRLPDVAVPLATYTGWNFRKPAIGAPGELVSLLGSSISFPATRAAREAAKDPRRSIEERYRSQEEYLAQVEQAADALVKAGYLLVDDEPRILQRATRSVGRDRRSLARQEEGETAPVSSCAVGSSGVERSRWWPSAFPARRRCGGRLGTMTGTARSRSAT